MLTIGRRGQPPPDDLLNFIGPDSILELLGVTAWPETAASTVEPDGSRWLQWKLATPVGAWAGTRIRVGMPGDLPAEVQLVDADGQVLLQAAHERPLTVEIAGAPPGAWPFVAGTTRFRRPQRPDSLLEVFWDAPGTNPERLKDRLFDLNVLREVLRPGEVRDLRQARP